MLSIKKKIEREIGAVSLVTTHRCSPTPPLMSVIPPKRSKTWILLMIIKIRNVFLMGKTGEEINSSFVVGIGDNFYDAGVKDENSSVFLSVCIFATENIEQRVYLTFHLCR